MTFNDVRRALAQWTVSAIKPGLTRTKSLLKLCGHPDRRFPVIQVAGTNGKGSVSIMLAAMLTQAGYKTGCYTSPHLFSEKERVLIDQQPVATSLYIQGAKKLLPVLKTMAKQGRQVTTFEAWTVLATLVFAQAGVDMAVVEVGLGGRFDATTALGRKILTLLTNVALDHTALLGATKSRICQEKMGIAKKGVPMLSSEADPKVRQCMRTLAQVKGAPLYFCGRYARDRLQLLAWQETRQGCRVRLKESGQKSWTVTTALHGSFQTLNTALAVMAGKWLAEQGWGIDQAVIQKGLQQVVWPGRMEILHDRPRIVLDGAHNPAAIQTLLSALEPQPKSLSLVMSVMKDKDVPAMAACLAPWVRQAWVFPSPWKARGLVPEKLAAILQEAGVTSVKAGSLRHAVEEAIAACGPKGKVLITGSLYHIAAARRAVRYWVNRCQPLF